MTAQIDIRQALTLLQSGQFKAALKLCKAGMRRFPREPGFANLAGMALSQSGNPREGAQYFVKALRLAPSDTVYQDNLAMAYVQSGQYDKAEALIQKILPRRSQQGSLYYQLGVMEMQRGALDRALQAATDAIEADRAMIADQGGMTPEFGQAVARAYNLRAVTHVAMGDDDRAYDDYRAALEFDPNNLETLSNISLQLARRMQTAKALAALEKALSMNPRHLNALQRYGIQLNEAGRRDEAVEVLNMALQVDPANSDILRELARIATADAMPQLKPKLDAAFAKARKGSIDRARVAFALAHCAEKTGQSDEAARLYGIANALTAELRPDDRARAGREEAAIMALFPSGHRVPQAPAGKGPVPIFVVGQPRSGTTLTELVLSAHPRITGVGEQAIAGRLAHPFLTEGATFGAQEAQAFARDYWTALPGQEGDPAGIVDKMPANYKYVGFLLAALPDAVILNAARDPRDVAWSMWRNWFPNQPMNYTFDMAAMAAEANAYARYIAHWKALFPGRVHDIVYEDLVSDLEGQSRRLAALCGVDWMPDMAAPERNTSAVRTASVNQVREGVHTRSIGGWAEHADTLAPFIEGLDPELWPGIR